MATPTAMQSFKHVYFRPRYEAKSFGKTRTVECCIICPTGNICENAACEKIFEKMDIPRGMEIIFVSANLDSWSMAGSLSIVLDGLPLAMANGHRVMVITPLYNNKDAWDTGYRAEIDVRDKYETVNFFHCYEKGVNQVFVDNPMFLQKVWGMTGDKMYNSVTSTDNHETQICFSLLFLAALEAPRILKFNNDHFSGPYGEDVVFVCNDWHTALLPCYLKSLYQPHGIYTNAKVAFCIHDIISQGRFAIDDFAILNLPDSFRPFEFNDGYDKSAKGNKMNWMKAGVEECDLLLTVSPYCAEELCTS